MCGNRDTRGQAEKQIAAEFDKMKQGGKAEYRSGLSSSMANNITRLIRDSKKVDQNKNQNMFNMAKTLAKWEPTWIIQVLKLT